jgi:TRAP-type mannitol/chloroaromatic compound transport system substrate-binding protein
LFLGTTIKKRGGVSMKKLKRLGVIGIALVVLCGLMIALPTPQAAAKEKTYKWVGQAFCGRSIGLFEGIDQLAYMIDKYTNGRIKIDCKQAGEMVPAGQVYDAAGQGIIDFGHGCPCLARSKSYAAQWFCDCPGAQSPIEEIIWFYNGGGKEIFEDIFHKRYNVHPILCNVVTSEVWVYSNKKIKTLDDLKGLKMRAAGVRGEVLQSMGASVVVLPGGEIVPAMERGVIDAMEYCNISPTYSIGFLDVTKYLYYHPTKSTSPIFLWAVNMKKWNELPDDLKKAVERASRDATLRSLAYWMEQDLLTLKKAVEVKRNEIFLLPEEVARAVDEASADYYYMKAKKDTDLARILESWAKFKKDYGEYGKWLDYLNKTHNIGLVKGDS